MRKCRRRQHTNLEMGLNLEQAVDSRKKEVKSEREREKKGEREKWRLAWVERDVSDCFVNPGSLQHEVGLSSLSRGLPMHRPKNRDTSCPIAHTKMNKKLQLHLIPFLASLRNGYTLLSDLTNSDSCQYFYSQFCDRILVKFRSLRFL